MKRVLKVGGSVLVIVLVLTVFTLRLTGFEPVDWLACPDCMSRPGFWLSGDIVTTPVADWSFTDQIELPPSGGRRVDLERRHIMVETRTPYFIPHSVVTTCFSHNGQLYMTASYGKGMVFPKDKFWTANVARDPRVRLKIGDKVYEMTLALITDRTEAVTVLESKWKKYPEIRPGGSPGGVVHLYRAFQRNVPEFGGTEARP